MAELYSCPEFSLSRVYIHSIRSESSRCLYASLRPSIRCHRSHLSHTLKNFQFTIICLPFVFLFPSVSLSPGLSISLFFLPLLPLLLSLSSLLFRSHFQSILPVQSARFYFFIFVPQNSHSYPQPCDTFVHHKCSNETNASAYRKYTYIYVREYTYTYIYIHIRTRPSEHTHTYTYTKYMYIIYRSHSHGLQQSFVI